MDPKSELRRVIENAGTQMPGNRIGTYGRELVIGPDEAPRTLNPGQEATAWGQVPTQDQRRDTHPGIGASRRKEIRAIQLVSLDAAVCPEEFRSVGLPERNELCGYFELTAEQALTGRRSEHLAGMQAGPQKLVAGPVGGAEAAIDEGSVLPRLAGQ